jgi:hypothetical protein
MGWVLFSVAFVFCVQGCLPKPEVTSSVTALPKSSLISTGPSPRPIATPTGTPAAVSASNPLELTAEANHFRVALKWKPDSTSGYYDVLRDGVLLTRITGYDTWDFVSPGKTHVYQIRPSSGQFFSELKVTTKTDAPSITIQGDYQLLSAISVRNKIMTSPKVTAADLGKVISIENARSVKWFREAPVWYHGRIVSVRADGTAELSGEPLDGDYTLGYTATNQWARLKSAMATAGIGVVEALGVVYADPIRAGDHTPIKVDRPSLLLKGQFIFGQEDQIGDRLDDMRSLQVIDHISGVFGVDGKIRGPLTVPMRNFQHRAHLSFYKRNIDASSVCEFHFRGIFGHPSNYRSGFWHMATNIRGYSGGRIQKDVLAIYSSEIYASEPFELRMYSDTLGVVTPYTGKRWIMRDVQVGGSAFVKPVGPVKANVRTVSATEAEITVNRILYPKFTFYELGNYGQWAQNLIFKSVSSGPGTANLFTTSTIRKLISTKDGYTARVLIAPPDLGKDTRFVRELITGEVDLIADTDMQPGMVAEGHVMYMSSMAEVELTRVVANGLRSFLIRQSNADEFKGPGHRQVSLYKVTWAASLDDGGAFDFINIFGGLVQFKVWPGAAVQFQPQGLQGKGLRQESTVWFQTDGLQWL